MAIVYNLSKQILQEQYINEIQIDYFLSYFNITIQSSSVKSDWNEVKTFCVFTSGYKFSEH